MTSRRLPGSCPPARQEHRRADVRLAVRAGLVVAAAVGVALVLGRLLAGVLLDESAAAERSGPAALDASVGTVAAAGALLTLGWWVTLFTVAVIGQARATIRSGRPVRPLRSASAWPVRPLPSASASPAGSLVGLPAPSIARRLAAVALGVALSAGPVAAHAEVDRPAGGAPSTTGASPTSPTGPADKGDEGHRHGSVRRTAWSADRPNGRGAVVVRPGDTLWALAAARLGESDPADDRPDDRPDDRAVAAAWPRWWHANRAVVGPDPDLIRPGQVLHPPTVSQEDR